VRAQQSAALALEAGERGIAVGQRAGNDRGQPFGGDQRVRDAAGRQRVGGARGVAQQHRARREPGTGAAGDGRPARQLRQRRRAVEPVTQQRVLADPARHRVTRVRPEGIAIAERREQQLAVGKRRRVQLVTAADEDLQARRLLPAGREAIVHAHADAPGFTGAPAAIEPERTADGRIETVRADHQSSAAQLAADVKADRPSARDRGAFDLGVVEHAYAWRRPRRREQRLVQMQAPLRERKRRRPVRADREAGLR